MHFTTYSCMILGILMSDEVKIAVLETQVERLLEKQKELTERVRANEKVVAAIGLLGSIALAVIGAGYFALKAEACSPRLDGEPTYCPDFDDVVLRDPPVQEKEEEEEDAFTHTLTLYDTRDDDPFDIAHMGHSFPTGEWIQKMRDHESRKTRTQPEDSINKALEDMEIDYGSNDTPVTQELLQLPSDKDSESIGRGYDRCSDRSWIRFIQERTGKNCRSRHS